MAIVCEDSGKVMLFDPIERSVHPKPAYTIADPSKLILAQNLTKYATHVVCFLL